MKMISIDDLIKYCDNERTAYKANNCGAACTALRRVAEFAKEYAVEAEHDKGWISVEDRMPEPNTWVLVFAKQGSYMNLRVDYITRDSIWFNSMCVTHWQPLPEPPKGE
jgi:hypothetical protein